MSTSPTSMPRTRPSRKRFVPTDPRLIVVSGVDSNLPPAVQIDMIDQLITARLANIDENLSKAHQVITNDLLPAVQRFAKVSQPTREAARFWRSFFELAAKVRVPTEGEEDLTHTETETETTGADDDTVDAQDDEQTFDEGDMTSDTIISGSRFKAQNARSAATTASTFLEGIDTTDNPDPNVTPSEHSFAPFIASTPAREGGGLTDDLTTNSSAASWTPPPRGSVVGGIDSSFEFSTDSAPAPVPGNKGKSKIADLGPFAFDISTTTASEASTSGPSISSITTTNTSRSVDSPDLDSRKIINSSKHKGKSKAVTGGDGLRQTVLKKQASKGAPRLSQFNPFLPLDTKEPWDGLVDLSTTSASLSTGEDRSLHDFTKLDLSSSSSSIGGSPSRPNVRDRLLPGGSTSDGRPLLDWSKTNSSVRFPEPHPDLVKLVATPSKKAAKLIVQDLLMGVDMNLLEDSPEMPTPPSIQRLHAHLQGMPPEPRLSLLEAMKNPLLKDDDDENGDLYDSDDSNDASQLYGQHQPSGSGGGGYQHDQHQQHDYEANDSFDSDASFNAGGDATPGRSDQHQHNNNQYDFDDNTDTLFGIRGNPPPPVQGFRLESDNSMHTFMGGGRLEDAVPFQPSPTPYTGAYEPLDQRQKIRSKGK
ncbi:DASH complex subunit ask1 [Tulasnella sp. JGI-2019a]|nr:DASH complex subunit ask1 [Tulasnella sp. JGI-2019a]KAG9029240.1 DASH complex subunit ask1 [Tulasnella sp. JGI-2019a]